MDGGAGVRLGDDQEPLRADLGARVGVERRQGPGRAGGLAQQAQAGVGDRGERLLVAVAGELVLPEPQERELVVREPPQQLHGVVDVLGRHGERRRAGLARGGGVEVGGDLGGLGAHGLPVGDARGDVGEDHLDLGFEPLDVLRVGEPLHLDVHPRLGVPVRGGGLLEVPVGVAADWDDRVDEHGDVDAVPVEQARQRVHQERGVVADEVDAGGGRRVGALGVVGAVDLQAHLARGAHLGHAAVVGGGLQELLGGAADEVVVGHQAPVQLDEPRE
nr:hypothetical protein GCM10025732_23480 [Glycomyces mayteni]